MSALYLPLLTVFEAVVWLVLLFAAAAVGFWVMSLCLPGPRPATAYYDKKTRTWNVNRYDDVVALIKSKKLTANFMPSLLKALPKKQVGNFEFLRFFFAQWPLFQDGAKQRFLHSILASFFTSTRVRGMESHVRETIADLLHSVQRRSEWDVVKDLAKPLPLRVIMRVLGFPAEDEKKLQMWADAVEEWFGGRGNLLVRFQRCQSALQEFTNHVKALQKRGVDESCLIWKMMAAVRKGTIQEEELIPNIFFLMSAGHETTTSLIANSLFVLLNPQNHGQLRLLQTDSSLLDACVDEMLRYVSPVTKMYRQVHVDVADFIFRDALFKPGQMIIFCNERANMDPLMFGERANVFTIQRKSKRKHLSFGVGDHTCPGQLLGRMQAKVTLEEVICSARFPHLRLAIPAQEIQRLPLDSINMIAAVPVTHKVPHSKKDR